MSFGHRPSLVTPKFESIYGRLFEGQVPPGFNSPEARTQAYADLLDLDVKRDYLEREFHRVSKDACLHRLKFFLNTLFEACLFHARAAMDGNGRKLHALMTLEIATRGVLEKNLTGLEVMDIFAGGVGGADGFFTGLANLVNEVIVNERAPAHLRHQCMRLAVSFVSGIAQLSPGAYFLRVDLYPSITAVAYLLPCPGRMSYRNILIYSALVQFIKSPATSEFASEALLLLGLLANYHKSDAARLNPYLRRIRETADQDLLKQISWAASRPLELAIRSYQDIVDDEIPRNAIRLSLESLFSSLRPDRLITSTPADPPRELFKDQPVPQAVVLLTLFEFVHNNAEFPKVFVSTAMSVDDGRSGDLKPSPFLLFTLASYMLTHCSSAASPRCSAYAKLCLNLLLALTDNNAAMSMLCQSADETIQLCRQRLPILPKPHAKRPPVCALLDCCVLWLRHNLHKQLEVYSYTVCIWVCYRIVWFLQDKVLRLEYHWKELWQALLTMLNFLYTKLDELVTTGGVAFLVQETICLLNLCISKAEIYLPTPGSLHELIYELVRSSTTLRRQETLLKLLALPRVDKAGESDESDEALERLRAVLGVVDYYEDKIDGATSANAAMGTVAREVEANGLQARAAEPRRPRGADDVLLFARVGCLDGIALMSKTWL